MHRGRLLGSLPAKHDPLTSTAPQLLLLLQLHNLAKQSLKLDEQDSYDRSVD